MNKAFFDRLPDGREVSIYTLKNDQLELRVLDYGCRIHSLFFDGRDFVCGFDDVNSYMVDTGYQGAFIGRVGNRIKAGKFTLNGKTYQLAKNENGKHYLHGVYSHTLWQVKEADDEKIVFVHHSPEEEEGYPGNMDLTVTYRLDGDCVVLHYDAIADADTPASFTNHAYFNMNGFGSGDVLSQEMQILADEITLVDDELIPIGKRMDVTGTAFDFREFQKIGARFTAEMDGYDHNYILSNTDNTEVCGYPLTRAATFRSERYALDCYTDMPCIQFYSGNFLGNGPAFKGGVPQARQNALCLETQYEPDAVNHGGGILPANTPYCHTTIYKFSRR